MGGWLYRYRGGGAGFAEDGPAPSSVTRSPSFPLKAVTERDMLLNNQAGGLGGYPLYKAVVEDWRTPSMKLN